MNWPSELIVGAALTPFPGTGVTLLSLEMSVVCPFGTQTRLEIDRAYRLTPVTKSVEVDTKAIKRPLLLIAGDAVDIRWLDQPRLSFDMTVVTPV